MKEKINKARRWFLEGVIKIVNPYKTNQNRENITTIFIETIKKVIRNYWEKSFHNKFGNLNEMETFLE